jgi:hypothetical protein
MKIAEQSVKMAHAGGQALLARCYACNMLNATGLGERRENSIEPCPVSLVSYPFGTRPLAALQRKLNLSPKVHPPMKRVLASANIANTCDGCGVEASISLPL